MKKSKHKKKVIVAEYLVEDEYGVNANCDICNANLDEKARYELNNTSYITLCMRCAKTLQRARIIKLKEPKPPPKLLNKNLFFNGKIVTGITDIGPTVKDLLSKGKVIEKHPRK